MASGRATSGAPRGAAFGIAAGLAFGVSALLTKTLMHYFGNGIFAWVSHWEPYALAVAAIGGVVIAQSALQTGALGAAVGATEATGPVSAAILGLVVFDERLTGDGALHALLVGVSVAAIIWGVAVLARAEERLATETRPPS
jgi:drug/metabolite transporter (DMT)-like permease